MKQNLSITCNSATMRPISEDQFKICFYEVDVEALIDDLLDGPHQQEIFKIVDRVRKEHREIDQLASEAL